MPAFFRNPRFVFAGIALAALLLGVGSYAWYQGRAGRADAPNPGDRAAVLAVLGVRPVQGSVPMGLQASGNIAPWQEVFIGAQSHGLRLNALYANVGDAVKKGQLLATFAAESVNADTLQAQAALLEAQAQQAQAQANAQRAASIADTGALSRQQIGQLQTAAKAADARVQAARAMLTNQKLRQGYTRVNAPYDGIISARSATLGAVLPAGAELFRMVRQGRLEWRAEVGAQDLGRIRVGDGATLSTSAGTQVHGTVRSLSPTLDAQRRVGLVYVDLPDARAQGLRAGMYATGSFLLGMAPGWMLPASAVVSRDGLDYVFAITPQHTVQQRRVQAGVRTRDMVHIVQGVDGHMLLVREGAGFLNDGDTVRVSTPAPAAPASGASAAH